MNFNSADIVQIIVAIIGLVGVVYSSRSKGGGTTPTHVKWQNLNKAWWASIIIVTANLAVFGWRIWGATPTECRYDNLLNCSIPVPIFIDSESRLSTTIGSGALAVDFSNGPKYSGVAFQFSPALNVQEFTHLAISGTATKDFKFVIEYKVNADGQIRVVKSSAFQLFPATNQASTIKIPLKYDGPVDEIAIMFYEPREESQVAIEAFRLSK